MEQAPIWVSVALFGILVAVAVPALLQLRKTLVTADNTLEIAERRLGGILKELTETLASINRSAEELEKVTKSASGLFQAFQVQRTGTALQKVKSSLRTVTAIGASVGPMLTAAVRGALNVDRGNGHDERHRMVATKEMM